MKGGGIAVVARKVDVTGNAMIDNDHMDVFTVGQDGHVLHSPWRFGDDNYQWNAARTEKLDAVAAPGAPVGAAAPHASESSDEATRNTCFTARAPSR